MNYNNFTRGFDKFFHIDFMDRKLETKIDRKSFYATYTSDNSDYYINLVINVFICKI